MDANVQIEEPVGEAAEAIAKRITAERERLVAEEQIEASLTVERRRLLTAGTDAETDECERRIDASRAAQVRILERVDLLTAQLLEANQVERTARLDAIEARANTLREQGEKLIRETYARQAKALAATLGRLAAIDLAIEQQNEQLRRAGRASVPVSNAIRYRHSQRLKWRETKLVGVGQPEHPAYGRVLRCSGDAKIAYLEGGGECAAFQEVQVDMNDMFVGDYPEPLFKVINLPSAEARPLVHKSLPPTGIPLPIFNPETPIDPSEVTALIAGVEEQRK